MVMQCKRHLECVRNSFFQKRGEEISFNRNYIVNKKCTNYQFDIET